MLGPPFPLSQPRSHGQTVSGIGTFAGRLCANDDAPLPDPQVVTSCPAARVACRTGVLTYSPVGRRRCGDCMFVTIEGASLFLDHSGCHVSMSGSTPEG